MAVKNLSVFDRINLRGIITDAYGRKGGKLDEVVILIDILQKTAFTDEEHERFQIRQETSPSGGTILKWENGEDKEIDFTKEELLIIKQYLLDKETWDLDVRILDFASKFVSLDELAIGT